MAKSKTKPPQLVGADLEIKYLDPKTLKADPRNSRTHTEAQIQNLVKSLDTYGWTNPILTDGKVTVVAGHARLQAALARGDKTVPTIALGKLSAMQRRAYLIADNKFALQADWDYGVLGEELKALTASGVEAAMLGFSMDELDAVVNGWASDIEDKRQDFDNDPTVGKLTVEVGAKDLSKAKTKVREVLEAAGIEFTLK